MRFLPAVLVVALLGFVACGDDDDEPSAAGVTTTTTTTTAPDDCTSDPAPPLAADGTPADVVAERGDLRFAVVDHGASVDVVSIFVEDDCELAPLQLDGATATLAVGGSVTHGDGLRCEDDRVTVLSATSDDGATYQATATTYEVDGTDLVEVDRSASTIEAQQDAESLDAYYRLDC